MDDSGNLEPMSDAIDRALAAFWAGSPVEFERMLSGSVPHRGDMSICGHLYEAIKEIDAAHCDRLIVELNRTQTRRQEE